MKRIVLTTLLGIFIATSASAQVQLKFHERFDLPSGADSVTSSNTNALLNSAWTTNTTLQVSPTQSYHTQIVPFDSVIFTSNTFSTINLPYVKLKFNQICKIHFGQRGYIQVSRNNGATWTTLTGTQYKGISPQFPTVGYFNELSYPSNQIVPYWGGQSLSQSTIVPPTNSWWSSETFDLTALLGLTLTSAQCKIRFIASHQVNTTVNPAGWFVDNIRVEASSCELDEPTFSYNLTPLNKPVSARYLANEILRIKARDKGGFNTGVDKDSVIVTWRINNGPWATNKMVATPPVAPLCPDSAIFQYTFMNLLVGDTIDWYVRIYDCACPNMTRDPVVSAVPNYYTFWRAPSPPFICGPVILPNSFPLVISSLPWDEDFEGAGWFPGTGTGDAGSTHRGTFPTANPPAGQNWTVAPTATSTGYAWSVRTGTTGTAQTGPDQDNTVAGTRYVYTEASQGSGPVTTQLTTPCIDLEGVSCAALEFYYHMYGVHTNLLRVDVDTSSTNTSKYVLGIWERQNQQHANSSTAYTRGFVSLEQFSGRIIRIRFVGRKNTSATQDKADMAIDDIRVFEPIPVDVDMFTYQQPQNGFCSYSSTEPVKATMQSLGCITLPNIPVAYKMEYTPAPPGAVVTTIKRDTITGPFGLGKDTAFTFDPKANMSAFGTYKFWVWSEAPGDTVNGNDTLGPFTVEHKAPYNTFPMVITFDDAGTIPGNGTAANPGTTSSPHWTRTPDPTLGGYAWHVKKSTTPSAATGPITDYSGKGNYLYTEGNFGTSPVSATYASDCISLVGLTNPVLDFRWYMFGADIGALAVQVVPVGSNVWSTIPGNQIVYNATNAHTNARSPWSYWSCSLSAYAGQVVKFRIIGQKTGSGVAADVAIDDLRIYNRVATDVGIERINPPGTRISMIAPVAPSFDIRNYGTATASNIPITYTITPRCGANAGVPVTYTTTYTGSIAAGATVTYAIPAANIPTYPEGSFEICANTTLAADPNAFNNSYCTYSVGWPQVPIQTGFFENFDNCNNAVESGFWRNGDYFVFDVGSPTSGSGSAPNCYTTRLFGTAQYPVNTFAGTEEYINAPRFIGFDTIVGAEFWFKHKFSFGGSDAGMLEIFNNSVWVPLGFQDPANAVGINWYNAANLPAAGNGSAFNNNSTQFPNTNGWVTSMWPLNVYNFNQNPLILRWRLISAGGGTSEWSIDDVEIRIPPQNSASPVFVDTEEYIALPDQNNTLVIQIQNTGAKRLDSCMVEFSTTGPGGPWSAPEKVVFSPPLFKGAVSGEYSFVQPWLSPPSGTYNVCVRTSRPNNKEDNLPTDDMYCKNITVSDKITFSATDSAYCNNFDDPSLVDWIALNWPTKQGLKSWEKGAPNQAPIIGAHSAPNAWMTNLTNNYRQRDSSSLFTPVFVLDSGQTYEMSFWHNFKTELYHDGGSVEISFDGWKTFRTIGYVLPDTSWFNTTHVTAIDIIRPGWTGESDGWIFSSIDLAFEAGVDRDQAMFRFRFASDQSFEYQGWAIDDFCWKKHTGTEPDVFIGIDEELPEGLLGIGNVVPNPTTGETMIPYVMNNPSNVRVSIYSMVGQQLLNFEQQSEEGINQIRFDVSGWSPGMYIVAIEVDGQITTRKVIVR